MISSSREERTPTVNTTLKAVVPPLESNRMPREDAKANKKRSRLVFERVSSVGRKETAPPSQRPTERQPLNEDNAAKRRVSPPALMSVGGGGRSKQPENGTVLFPFDSRFSHDFDCWQSEWMRRRRRGTRLSQHTHRTAGMGAKRPKGERRGIFFIAKKKVLRRIWEAAARALFLFLKSVKVCARFEARKKELYE